MRMRTLFALAALVRVELDGGGGGRGLQPHGVPFVCPEVVTVSRSDGIFVDAMFSTEIAASECVQRLLTMDGVRSATIGTHASAPSS